MSRHELGPTQDLSPSSEAPRKLGSEVSSVGPSRSQNGGPKAVGPGDMGREATAETQALMRKRVLDLNGKGSRTEIRDSQGAFGFRRHIPESPNRHLATRVQMRPLISLAHLWSDSLPRGQSYGSQRLSLFCLKALLVPSRPPLRTMSEVPSVASLRPPDSQAHGPSAVPDGALSPDGTRAQRPSLTTPRAAPRSSSVSLWGGSFTCHLILILPALSGLLPD